MRRMFKLAIVSAAMIFAAAASSHAADKWGLKPGSPELQSAGALAFGPDGILFVGDAKAATVFAIATGDTQGEPAKAKWTIENLREKLAETLGSSPQQIALIDVAVNPLTGNLFLSATVGGKPTLVRVDAKGMTPLALRDVPFLKAVLKDAPEDKEVGEGPRKRNLRGESITDIAFQTGWSSLGSFSRTVRDITGKTPTELRAQTVARPAMPTAASRRARERSGDVGGIGMGGNGA